MIQKYDHAVRTITDTSMTFTFSSYYVNKPTVLVTFSTGVTNVTISLIPEYLATIGEVYQKVSLTFQEEDIGKEFNIMIIGV